ncbi:MAG TPA: hypothetical protein VF037_03890 [Gemmatimonadales bacterium]
MHAALAIALLTACSGSPPAAPAVTLRDSAGIRIVEHSAEAFRRLPEWEIAAEAAVTVGGAGAPDDDLSEVAGGYLAPDGTIVVADAAAREIRVYSADGSIRRSLGRQGSGPGEFTIITSVWQQGDSTAVYDMSAKRLTVLPNDGSPPRVVPLGLTGLLESMQGAARGHLVTSRLDVQALLGVTSETERVPMHLLVITPDGEAIDTVATVQGPAFYLPADSPGWSGPATVGLGPETRLLAVGDTILVATNERFELVGYGLDGRPATIIRVAVPRRPVTQEDVELSRRQAWEEFEARARNMPPEITAQYRSFLEAQRYAAHLPFVGSLAADAGGNIWVQEYPRPGDDADRFTIVGRDGALLARATLPAGLELLAAGNDRILGLSRDADGVQQVRVHRLGRE